MLATLGYYIQMQMITSDISDDVLESGGTQYVQLGVNLAGREINSHPDF
jgi:hypothetical protein